MRNEDILMEYEEAFNKIVEDIFSIYTKFPPKTKIYIGKTDNEDETVKRHQKEGYAYITFLAKSDPKIVSKLESDLIDYFQESEIPCSNINQGSAGNPKADIIYVCFDNYFEDDILSEDFDILGQNYLLTIE